ncbi:hypothetical protein CVT25_015011 [Psilocybe cyanescens]|uniref:Uncharacterized protein n=1 Tax=Psilocybe cyanescens TaxID=93625 RepID=A0A409XAE4_PSICY|nr:hypothetical protein CVT25_015011 [Psilocybe cyanescens]
MQQHILALQIFDEPEPAPSHAYRQIAPLPYLPTSRPIRPPSTLLSKMTITPGAGKSPQRPRPTGLENDGDKGKGREKSKGKGKGKGKGNRGDMKGTGLAATPAKKRVRVDNSMSGSGAALAPAFNLALAGITVEDVARWKTLDEILPLLEDRIEKLEAIVDKNGRAFDKLRQQVKKNVDVILAFDGEIGQLFNAMGDMQERVGKLERTSICEHAPGIVAGENAGSGNTSLPPSPSLLRLASVNQPVPIVEGQRSPQPVVDPPPASPVVASVAMPDPAPASDLASALNVRPTSSSPTANTLAPTTDLPSGAVPGPGLDPYLHRKSDPNRPVHGCIYHNITGNVIWRYHPDSSNAAPLTNEDVDMEHPVATIATPTTSTSSGDMPSLPVASYSPEENKGSSPPPPSPGSVPAPSTSNSESQQPVMITRRPTPISPLHGRGNLVDHNTSDEMDME